MDHLEVVRLLEQLGGKVWEDGNVSGCGWGDLHGRNTPAAEAAAVMTAAAAADQAAAVFSHVQRACVLLVQGQQPHIVWQQPRQLRMGCAGCGWPTHTCVNT